MAAATTTIRVSKDQREKLRQLAQARNATMAATLDAALESLRRERFYEEMATAEQRLRSDAGAWDVYIREREAWLHPDLKTT